jgi:hypothetical protein
MITGSGNDAKQEVTPLTQINGAAKKRSFTTARATAELVDNFAGGA